MTERSVRVLVGGQVQGVGFRAFVAREARRLGVAGLVRNLSDGRVEVLVRGDPDGVAVICEACGRGPIGSYVARVDVTATSATDNEPGFEPGFRIAPDG